MYQHDNLLVVNPRQACLACGGTRRKRRDCEVCSGTGYKRIDLRGLWHPAPAFLVCGGPSINKINYKRVAERGVM